MKYTADATAPLIKAGTKNHSAMLSPNLWHLAGMILKKDMAHRMPDEVFPLLTVMYELLNLNICHDTFWKPDVEEEVQH